MLCIYVSCLGESERVQIKTRWLGFGLTLGKGEYAWCPFLCNTWGSLNFRAALFTVAPVLLDEQAGYIWMALSHMRNVECTRRWPVWWRPSWCSRMVCLLPSVCNQTSPRCCTRRGNDKLRLEIIQTFNDHQNFLNFSNSSCSTPESDICMDFDTNEYPNIFMSRKWHERISKYICYNFLTRTNIRIYSYQKFWYKWISE